MMDFDESFIMNQDLEEPEQAQEAKEGPRRGRKPGRRSADKMDVKAKLERSRQSARECRARKKLRYQYLEELVTEREKAVMLLRRELDKYRASVKDVEEGRMTEEVQVLLSELGIIKQET
ncbi:REPTOR-binding partner [Nilaparvata lugens]|uniref:REPTOR-binding partner n=1 Tax=Nilaparvata lugens TaxID=108931 RepID=UPI000B9905E4|nr:REPTOR-binding partner [Nilaparvata lugens]